MVMRAIAKNNKGRDKFILPAELGIKGQLMTNLFQKA